MTIQSYRLRAIDCQRALRRCVHSAKSVARRTFTLFRGGRPFGRPLHDMAIKIDDLRPSSLPYRLSVLSNSQQRGQRQLSATISDLHRQFNSNYMQQTVLLRSDSLANSDLCRARAIRPAKLAAGLRRVDRRPWDMYTNRHHLYPQQSNRAFRHRVNE